MLIIPVSEDFVDAEKKDFEEFMSRRHQSAFKFQESCRDERRQYVVLEREAREVLIISHFHV